MTNQQQRAELHRRIWQIANDIRGAVDGWDFKQYVLGTLFYRFTSENFCAFMDTGNTGTRYAEMNDEDIAPLARQMAVQAKGYYIAPSQLFENVQKNAYQNENLNTDLAAIFQSIENSSIGHDSESDIKGLFADFDVTSSRLGNTVKLKNQKLAAVLNGVAELDLGSFEDNEIDLFGDAYEFLISNYAANAGKSGGEFFTPQPVSKLLAHLVKHNQPTINKIYDPACGSGSLLLQARKLFGPDAIEEGYFGQEINHTTYNLARMNMFLHDINYSKFNIALGDTLADPHFGEDKPFDAIVSNPPYAVKWAGDTDPVLKADERYAPAGVLAPPSKADFAFVMHSLHYLSPKGRAAIVCFPGIFYRGGAEKKIRQYLVDNNFIEAVIALPPNLFFGTSIAVNVLILSKHKQDTNVLFMDVCGEDFFQKATNNNDLLDVHIKKIVEIFARAEDIDRVSKLADYEKIKDNGYNLAVNNYVRSEDTGIDLDINELNHELEKTVASINRMRDEVNSIIREIGKTN